MNNNCYYFLADHFDVDEVRGGDETMDGSYLFSQNAEYAESPVF